MGGHAVRQQVPNATHETRRELVQEILFIAIFGTAGSGRYSVWEGRLFFSLVGKCIKVTFDESTDDDQPT